MSETLEYRLQAVHATLWLCIQCVCMVGAFAGILLASEVLDYVISGGLFLAGILAMWGVYARLTHGLHRSLYERMHGEFTCPPLVEWRDRLRADGKLGGDHR